MDKNGEKFFYEDEVAMVSQKTGLVKYGLVLSTNRSRSECDLKKRSRKKTDEIKVIWHPNGTEEVIPDNKVVLMDRSLMPGDVVRKISKGILSQFGYCENINIQTTVKILNTNKIIENVSSRDLTPTKPFAIDSSVFYESWVGGIYDVKFKVTFASQDGSIFTLEDPFRQDFISLSSSDSFSVDENVFYPGQKLKMCFDSIVNAKFLTISNLMSCLYYYNKKKYNFKFSSKWIKVYVKDVTVTSVEVEWYCQTSCKNRPYDRNWPKRTISGDNLKKLKTIDLFESCSIQLGDTHWYTIKETDKLMTMKQWRSMCTETFTTGSESLMNTAKNKRTIKQLSTKKPPKSAISSLGSCNHPQNTIIRNVSDVNMQRLFCNDIKYEFFPIKSENKSTSTTGNSSKLTMKSNRLKRNRMWKSLVKKSKRFNVPKVTTKSNSKVVVEICKTQSMVDVIWQDGTKERRVSSTDLYPVQNLDDLEFFPGDFVVEKNPPANIYGVIESVDHAERTACVQWFKVNPEKPSLPNPIEKTDFSVYDLRDHPDFHFKSGSLVIHVSSDTNPDTSTFTAGQVLNAGPDGKVLVMWINGEKTECWPQELFVVKLLDDDNDDDFSYHDGEFDDDDDDDDDDLTHAVVDDVSSEDWISSPGSSNDQENEKCSKLLIETLKQAISGINVFMNAINNSRGVEKSDMVIQFKNSLEQIRKEINFHSLLPTSENSEKELSYLDLMEMITKKIEQSILKLDNKEVETENLYKNKGSIIKIRETVADFINKVNQIVKEPCINYSNVVVTSEHGKKEGQRETFDQFMNRLNTDTIEPNEFKSIINKIEHNLAEFHSNDASKNPKLEIIAKPEEAGVFDIVETLPDNSHAYMKDKENLHPSLLKIVHKDIQILQKSLPAGIWVKTFEDRMDLFSIMIRGPEKTPYASGLFMFDVKIPSTYPHEPPLCHYFSFCDDRLNPNLYEDGKVCLSLLGTWSGHGVELWSPKDSNLLQLLVSIQGLILVSEPYYNEAGFDSQRGQQLAMENSRVYNEMVLIKVVQSMTNLIASLSQAKAAIHFEKEIMEHVKYHGPKLINTIENWMKMSQRELSADEKLSPGYPLLPLSKGFCLSIKKPLINYKEILFSMNVISI